MQHVKAGLVGSEPGALFLHAAEGAHRDVAIGLAAPRTSPVLQLQQLLRRLAHESFDGVLIAQPIAPGDSVVAVFVERVVRLGHAGRAALGRDRVAAHGIDLGDHRHAEFGISFRDRDGRAQSGAAAADQQNIVRGRIHQYRGIRRRKLTILPQSR